MLLSRTQKRVEASSALDALPRRMKTNADCVACAMTEQAIDRVPATAALYSQLLRAACWTASMSAVGMRITLPAWSMHACLVEPVANRSLSDSREIR